MNYNNSKQISAVIFAGGNSLRMGQDKALMCGGVERIRQLCQECGIGNIVTLCGDKERISMFEGKVWPDPEYCEKLSDVIRWVHRKIAGPIQYIPCDAFDLDRESLQTLLQCGGGVPLDSDSNRQPLLANCPADYQLSEGDSVNSLFANLASINITKGADNFSNYNDKSQLKDRHQQ
ncbi:MAG: NTP transferase domain-containing protein [Candidatus Poseidoniaceae archaeon]|nr:NTP transferase domain-containing protein [Candidatus Poseidoniaceae archaeon]